MTSERIHASRSATRRLPAGRTLHRGQQTLPDYRSGLRKQFLEPCSPVGSTMPSPVLKAKYVTASENNPTARVVTRELCCAMENCVATVGNTLVSSAHATPVSPSNTSGPLDINRNNPLSACSRATMIVEPNRSFDCSFQSFDLKCSL